jgi:hypothetical protein
MKKNIFIIALVILILTSLALGIIGVTQTKMVSSQEAAQFVQLMRNEISKQIPTQIPKWFSATVVAVNGGVITVHLPTDPIGTNIDVQNSRELALEIGDPVYITAINGDLSNAYVDLRRTINNNYLYVDYNLGVDQYVLDGGTISNPFKTIQYAINRIPKNLNGRNIYTNLVNTSTSEEIIVDNLYGGGSLRIIADSPKTIKKISVLNCNVPIYLLNIACSTTDDLGYGIKFDNVNAYIYIDTCDVSESCHGFPIGIIGCTNVHIVGSTCSNQYRGILVENSTVSIENCIIDSNTDGIVAFSSSIYSNNNSGDNSRYGLRSEFNSTIGKKSTQPTGSSANEYSDTSSVIR